MKTQWCCRELCEAVSKEQITVSPSNYYESPVFSGESVFLVFYVNGFHKVINFCPWCRTEMYISSKKAT